jgi:heme-degrading monooxygenase HmoA
MIREVAILSIRPGAEAAFERDFALAAPLIQSIPDYLFHELGRCLESPHRYVLLVQWRALEDHTLGFRQSAAYLEWARLLHHYYDPFPTVEHYQPVAIVSAPDSAPTPKNAPF